MPETKINDWVLEQYLLNELPANQVKEVETRLNIDRALRTRLHELQQSNEAILKQYPPGVMVPGIMDRYRTRKAGQDFQDKQLNIHINKPTRGSRFSRGLTWAVPTLVAVVLVFLVVLPLSRGKELRDSTGMSSLEVTRLKGTKPGDVEKPNLLIYRKKADKEEQLKANDVAWAGDELQVAYIAGDQPYGVILSIDGRGVITLHYPDKETGSTILKTRVKVLLANAYELDDAPAFERFFLVTSSQPLDVGWVIEKARELAADQKASRTRAIPLDKQFQQVSFIILKGE